MKPTIRFFWRSTVAVVAMLALGACAVGVPDDSDGTDTAEGEDGIVTPMEVLPINPSWVGTCSQGYATYILRRATAGCPSFSIDGGTWWGCRLQADEPNFCVYKWSKATAPTTNAYMALQGKAALVPTVSGVDRYAISADCGERRASCGSSPLVGTLSYACGSPQECCEMIDDAHYWDPITQQCKHHPIPQPSCDVCGFFRNGTLFAVIDARWPDTSTYRVSSGFVSWTVTRPRGVQSFQISGLPGAPFNATASIRPIY